MTLEYPKPIVNGCYLSGNSEMFKVLLVSYANTQATSVLVEDIQGGVHKLDLDTWQELRPVPFCLSTNFTPARLNS